MINIPLKSNGSDHVTLKTTTSIAIYNNNIIIADGQIDRQTIE